MTIGLQASTSLTGLENPRRTLAERESVMSVINLKPFSSSVSRRPRWRWFGSVWDLSWQVMELIESSLSTGIGHQSISVRRAEGLKLKSIERESAEERQRIQVSGSLFGFYGRGCLKRVSVVVGVAFKQIFPFYLRKRNQLQT